MWINLWETYFDIMFTNVTKVLFSAYLHFRIRKCFPFPHIPVFPLVKFRSYTLQQAFLYFAAIMGSSASKKVMDKASLSKVIDHPVQTSDVSTGFHILEVHMPSVGMGWLSILIFVLGALAIYAIWRRFRQQGHPHVGHSRHRYPCPVGPSPFMDGPWDRLPRDFVPHPIDTGQGH